MMSYGPTAKLSFMASIACGPTVTLLGGCKFRGCRTSNANYLTIQWNSACENIAHPPNDLAEWQNVLCGHSLDGQGLDERGEC